MFSRRLDIPDSFSFLAVPMPHVLVVFWSRSLKECFATHSADRADVKYKLITSQLSNVNM